MRSDRNRRLPHHSSIDELRVRTLRFHSGEEIPKRRSVDHRIGRARLLQTKAGCFWRYASDSDSYGNAGVVILQLALFLEELAHAFFLRK